jgi:xanthine/uracil permease
MIAPSNRLVSDHHPINVSSSIAAHATNRGVSAQHTDLIQASLLVCGLSSLMQVTGLRFGRIAWGAGILSVMGVSFTSVGIWQQAIGTMMVGLSALPSHQC